jgi:hypothetical protein
VSEQTRIDGLHDPPGMRMLMVTSSASAVVRMVIVGFLIVFDGENRRGSLLRLSATMPLAPGVFVPPVRMVW